MWVMTDWLKNELQCALIRIPGDDWQGKVSRGCRDWFLNHIQIFSPPGHLPDSPLLLTFFPPPPPTGYLLRISAKPSGLQRLGCSNMDACGRAAYFTNAAVVYFRFISPTAPPSTGLGHGSFEDGEN